jgi:DNA-binding transcriptional regulator YhcF (GntR family)
MIPMTSLDELLRLSTLREMADHLNIRYAIISRAMKWIEQRGHMC